MVTPRLRAAWVLAVIGSAFVALVSGTVFVIAVAVGSDGDDKAAADSWERSIAWPVSVRRTSDARTAIVVYDVPAGQPDCFREPKARIDRETAKSVEVSLTYEVGRLDCTLTDRAEIRVASKWVLRSRDVIVNGEAWTPRGKAAYRHCTDAGCTPPPPPNCRDEAIADALRTIDVPGDTARKTRACTTRWLITDVSPAGSASAQGDSESRRWFFEYRDNAWHPLLGTRNPACASIRSTQPAFPTQLCQDLPTPS